MEIKILLFVAIISVKGVHLDLNIRYPALDESLYEDVLDAEQCHEQIRVIRRNPTLQIQCKSLNRNIRLFSVIEFLK